MMTIIVNPKSEKGKRRQQQGSRSKTFDNKDDPHL
jgi:hypothetical protein